MTAWQHGIAAFALGQMNRCRNIILDPAFHFCCIASFRRRFLNYNMNKALYPVEIGVGLPQEMALLWRQELSAHVLAPVLKRA